MSKEKHIDFCDYNHVHPERLEATDLPKEETIYHLAELYKVFGDQTRVRILFALKSQELCVCDITQLLGMTQSAISHQLRILKQAHLVKFRREGKAIFYSLADNHVETILKQGLDHVNE